MHEHRLPVSRTARYFTLGAAATAAREVWFVLHGYGQLAARFLRGFAPLDDGKRLIVAPEALSRFYLDPAEHQKVGATWMTREDRLTEIADYVRYLDAVYQDVFVRVQRAGKTVQVLGFSQGAATACRWAALGSTEIDRLIVWSGEVPPDLDLAGLRRIPLVFVHGRQDEFITSKVAATIEARLREHGIQYRMVPFEGAHELDEGLLVGVAQFPAAASGRGG